MNARIEKILLSKAKYVDPERWNELYEYAQQIANDLKNGEIIYNTTFPSDDYFLDPDNEYLIRPKYEKIIVVEKLSRLYLFYVQRGIYHDYGGYKEDDTYHYYYTDLNDDFDYTPYVEVTTKQHYLPSYVEIHKTTLDKIMWSPSTICASLSRKYHFNSSNLNPTASEWARKHNLNASGILYANWKLAKEPIDCYEYDMKHAWLQTFSKCDLPDTTKEPRFNDYVKENEIGFIGNEVVLSGFPFPADIVFPIMHDPNPKFTKQLIKEIDTAKNKIIRKNAKNKFNIYLGSLQHINPFIRVAIISQCNTRIERLINKYKKHVIYSNTDSIALDTRIEELDNDPDFTIKKAGKLILTDKSGGRIYLDENGIIKDANIRGVSKKHIIGMTVDEFKSKNIKTKELNIFKFDLKKGIIENA